MYTLGLEIKFQYILLKSLNIKALSCWLSACSTLLTSVSTSLVPVLTQLLQRGNAELVIMVVGQGRHALSHDLRGDGISRHLDRFHTADQSLEALVGKRRLTPI